MPPHRTHYTLQHDDTGGVRTVKGFDSNGLRMRVYTELHARAPRVRAKKTGPDKQPTFDWEGSENTIKVGSEDSTVFLTFGCW